MSSSASYLSIIPYMNCCGHANMSLPDRQRAMRRSMLGFVETQMLLDAVETRGVVIDGHRYFMDVVAHALHIRANTLKFRANAVESLREDADLGLSLFVARGDRGELRGVLGAHFLQFAKNQIFGLGRHSLFLQYTDDLCRDVFSGSSIP